VRASDLVLRLEAALINQEQPHEGEEHLNESEEQPNKERSS